MSRALKIMIVMGVVLVGLAASGLLQANRDTKISKVQAVETALEQIDFEPDNQAIRFVRSGAQLRPTWIVSLTTDPDDDSAGRLTVVQVDADSGDVMRVINER